MSDGDETPDDETPETEDGEGAAPGEETAETNAEKSPEEESAEAESTDEASEVDSAEEATEEEATEEEVTEEEAVEADTGAKNEGGDETADSAESADVDSEGDAEVAEDADADSDEPQPEEQAMEATVTGEEIDQRLDAVEEDLEAAETEAELDVVEAEIDDIEADLDRADVPETLEADEDGDGDEDGDEEEATNEHSREEFESRIETLRDSLESKRGPYGEDVVATVEEAETTITDTRWTERGEGEVAEAVRTFTDEVSEVLRGTFEPSGDDEDSLIDALDEVVAAVEDANLHADDDADDIAALMEAADGLTEDLENAQAWDDLETREKLEAQGYYDCLGHYKDFPPEWAALKEWEKRGNVEMVLLALDSFQSDFMEEHALHALTRMNDQGAFEEMHQMAQKRNKMAIEALGKMRATDAVETLVEYVDADSDPALQKVTFKALGEIGDESATQALANKLDMDNDNLRPHAARALGILGDTRAVDPLVDTLANDEDEAVRAAAAWALRQIGTRRALEAAAEYADESSYILQYEAEKALDDLDTDPDADATPATGD